MQLKNFIESQKKEGLACLSESNTVLEAAQMMRSSHCGNIIALDDQGHFAGIITDRDIVLRLVAEGEDPSQVKLADVMTADLVYLDEESTGSEALNKMEEEGISRIVVCDKDKKPLGVVSADKLMKYLADELYRLSHLSKEMHEHEVEQSKAA